MQHEMQVSVKHEYACMHVCMHAFMHAFTAIRKQKGGSIICVPLSLSWNCCIHVNAPPASSPVLHRRSVLLLVLHLSTCQYDFHILACTEAGIQRQYVQEILISSHYSCWFSLKWKGNHLTSYHGCSFPSSLETRTLLSCTQTSAC